MNHHSKPRTTHSLHADKAYRAMFVTALACAGMFIYWQGGAITASEAATRFAGPTSSQPLALTADDAFLAVANPDNNTVSFFDVRGDKNRKLAEVPVQMEPNGVAFLPDGTKLYVANTVSGTVTVIRTNIANGVISRPTCTYAWAPSLTDSR